MVKKILGWIEAYVQWGTLVLGAAFLFYMIYAYLFVNPAAKPLQVNGVTETATPATVDKLINDGQAALLDTAIHKTGQIVPIPLPPAPTVDLSPPPSTQPAVVGAFNSWTLDLSARPQNQDIFQQVASLPQLPAAAYFDFEPLRTVITANDGTKQTIDSVTTFWTVPIEALSKSYDAAFAKLAAGKRLTEFVHADLVRQQLQPDGSWGPEKTIADRVFLPTPPPAYPDRSDAQLQQDAGNYTVWLGTPGSQKSLVESDFPTVAYPDRPELQWKPLDQWVIYRAQQQTQAITPIAAAPTAGANPNNPPPNVFGGGPGQANAAPPAGGNPFGGGNGGDQTTGDQNGGGPGGANPGGPGPSGASGPGGGRGGNRGGGRGGPGGRSGGNQPGGMRGGGRSQTPAPVTRPAPAPLVPQMPAPTPPPKPIEPRQLPVLQAVQDAAFDPDALKALGDIEIWFHDPTVLPGATYRYMVRYSLKNPIFNTPQLAAKPELALAYGIVGQDSDWSEAITVQGRTKFFCADKNPSARSQNVHFTVFYWRDGDWSKQDYKNVAPGDEVGDGEFVTNFTLISASVPHSDEPRQIILAPDDGGPAIARNERQDAGSPEMQHMLADIAARADSASGQQQAPTAPPGPAAPNPFGGPPPDQQQPQNQPPPFQPPPPQDQRGR